MNGKLISKYIAIEYLLFSTRNVVVVEEEIGQFNDLFKMSLGAHEEYNEFLEDEATRVKDNEWFGEIDIKVFSVKRKTTRWLKNVEEENKPKGSSRSSRTSGSGT